MVVTAHLLLSRLFDLRKALISILIRYHTISQISQCLFQVHNKWVVTPVGRQRWPALTSNINTSLSHIPIFKKLTNITATKGCTKVLLWTLFIWFIVHSNLRSFILDIKEQHIYSLLFEGTNITSRWRNWIFNNICHLWA